MKATAEVPEGSRGFRIAVLAALLAAGASLLQQGVGGAATRAIVLVGYPVAFAVAYAARNHRPLALRIVVTAVGFVVMLIFSVSLSSRSLGGFAALQLPLAEAFLWLLFVHAFDSPGRRSLLISLLASTVMVAVAGVVSLSMDIAPYLLVWAVAAVAALVLAQRALLARLPRLVPGGPSRTRAVFGTTGAIAAVLAFTIAVGSVVFMLAPVAGTSRALTFPSELPRTDSVPVLGGLSNPSLGSSDPARVARPGGPRAAASFGYFGFSDRLDTATRGRPDNTLVMRVRASAPDFWRAQTFDAWDGRQWTVSQTRARPIRGGQPIAIPRAPDDGPALGIVGTDELVQTYYVERPGPNSIFAAATPTKLFFEDRAVFQLPDGALRAGVKLDQGSVYTVVSDRRLVTEAALRASPSGPLPPEIRDRYAREPTTTARVRALAASVTADAPTAYDKVRALEAWTGAHTKYTLDIPPLPEGADAVDQFLFVDRRGFCEQIGTSLVVMLRALGIPARLAVGYATGERNPFTGLYEVRAKNAHAWAEVYFPGVGWQGFDPTASVPLAGDSAIDSAGTGALAYLDARFEMPAWLPTALVLVAAVAVLGTAIGWAARRPRRRRDRVMPSWAALGLAEVERLGAKLGRPRAPGETTPEYAAALARLDPFTAPSLDAMASVLDAAMFAPAAVRPEERDQVDQTVANLTERWRNRRPVRLEPLARA